MAQRAERDVDKGALENKWGPGRVKNKEPKRRAARWLNESGEDEWETVNQNLKCQGAAADSNIKVSSVIDLTSVCVHSVTSGWTL